MIGIEAFSSLKAEEEGMWLLEAFIPPPDFQSLCEPRSFVILGKEGSGKTALYRALIDRASFNYLLVKWEPFFPSKDPTSREGLFEMIRVVFRSIALALLEYIAQRLNEVPNWVRDFILSFTHYALGENWKDELKLRGLVDYIPLITLAPSLPLSMTGSPPLCIAELLKAISFLGLKGIWILGDNLEKWLSADEETAVACLQSFFSTLPLFEVPGFCFKFFLPLERKLPVYKLRKASGIERRRVEIYQIKWTKETLKEIVERRFHVASGGKVSSLSQVIENDFLPDLLSWLERWGGELPKGWLEAARPLACLYFNSSMGKPVKKEEWLQARRSILPRLILDREERKVIVGWREIEDIPESLYSILAYLEEKPGKLCSREELYYKAYRKYPSIPNSKEPKWEESWVWTELLDNLLYRLRQLIEPDPSDPILITTLRGKGVKLEQLL